MAFASTHLSDFASTLAGETKSFSGIDLPFSNFENNLVTGRFAKWNSGSSRLDNVDGSGSPTLVGVVLRDPARATEDGANISSDLEDTVDARRNGLVTVEVISGNTPSPFGTVYVSNAGNSDDGKATTDSNQESFPGQAIFWQDMGNNVWTILLK
jgi:hypothetical protein